VRTEEVNAGEINAKEINAKEINDGLKAEQIFYIYSTIMDYFNISLIYYGLTDGVSFCYI